MEKGELIDDYPGEKRKKKFRKTTTTAKAITEIYLQTNISERTTITTTTTVTPGRVKNCCPTIRVKNKWEPKGKTPFF